jgi:cytoskeletal protein CcmA (bactofilin family)
VPGVKLQLGTLAGVSYTVQAFDEDDPNRGLTLSAAAISEIDENSSALTDGNKKIVLRAIGYGRNNTTVTLEAIIGTTTLPALVTNGDLDVQGNLTLEGQNGGVHANGNLTLGSGSVAIAEDATASGIADIHASADVGGLEAGGQPTKTVPAVNAADYYSFADYLLDEDGLIKNAQTLAPLCASSAACETAFGWTYLGGKDWSLNDNTVTGGTYYSKGLVRMIGSPGPVTLSILAEGDIDIQGNANLTPDVQPNFDMLFVTNGDLEITGNFATPLIVEGVILVRGQLEIAGSPDIAGQVLVENVTGAGTLADVNWIGGNPTITYNGTAGNDTFDLASWREIK